MDEDEISVRSDRLIEPVIKNKTKQKKTMRLPKVPNGDHAEI